MQCAQEFGISILSFGFGEKKYALFKQQKFKCYRLLYRSVFKLSYERMVCNIMNTGKPKTGIEFGWSCTPNFPGGKVGT